MDTRELLDASKNSNHGHINKSELDLITIGSVDKWNNKAEKEHNHNANEIVVSDDRQFITKEEKDKINNPSKTLPIASPTSLGAIKIGNGLLIESDGKLNAKITDKIIKWEDVINKPKAYFPTTHTHTKEQISNLFIVEDSLSSNSHENPLSVAQGKLINDRTIENENNIRNIILKIPDEKILYWNNKAEKEHSHKAEDIITTDLMQFVTKTEKEKIKSAPMIDDQKTTINNTWSANKIKSELDKKIISQTSKVFYKKEEIKTWSIDEESGLYKSIIQHNLNSTDLIINAKSISSNINQVISFKILNQNSVEIFNTSNEGLCLNILAPAFQEAEVYNKKDVDFLKEEISNLKKEIESLKNKK